MNRRAHLIRCDERGMSALYGAFGVLIVATVVVGIVLTAANDGAKSVSMSSEGKTADLFLSTILSSTAGAEGPSVRHAVSTLCLGPKCTNATRAPSHLAATLESLAAPIAKSLDHRWSISVTNGSAEVLSVGDLAPSQPGTASRAEILHPDSRGVLTVTLRIAPL